LYKRDYRMETISEKKLLDILDRFYGK